MKKTLTIVLFVLLFAPIYVNAQSEIQVKLNGNLIELEPPPIIVDGRVLVPVRGVFETMGFDVMWDNRTQTVSLATYAVTRTHTRALIEFLVVIGRPYFLSLGGSSIWSLDVPAQIIDGRAMLPVSGLSRAFGAITTWEEEQNLVNITFYGLSSLVAPTIITSFYLPLVYFSVSETWKLEQNIIQTAIPITAPLPLNDIFSKWADLNDLTSVRFMYTRMGAGAGRIGLMSPRTHPASENNSFVLYLSHSKEFEERINSEHGPTLLKALEKTMRGLFYFGDFSVVLR